MAVCECSWGVYLKNAITSVNLVYRDGALTGSEGNQRQPTWNTYRKATEIIGSKSIACRREMGNNVDHRGRIHVRRTVKMWRRINTSSEVKGLLPWMLVLLRLNIGEVAQIFISPQEISSFQHTELLHGLEGVALQVSNLIINWRIPSHGV
jgi:hypothetical protein